MNQLLIRTAVMGAIVLASRSSSGQIAKYCGGALVANSMYGVTSSSGSTATVEYHGLFQNVDTQRRTVVVIMPALPKLGQFVFTKKTDQFELAAYQQKDVAIATTRTTNPSGSGAPTPADVGRLLQAVCRYK